MFFIAVARVLSSLWQLIVFTSGRIVVLHAPGLSELEGIEVLNFSGKLSSETFGHVSET